MQPDSALPATDFELKARELIGEGFCVLEGMLDAGTLGHTRDVAMEAVSELSEEQLEATRSPGTLINSNDYQGLAECIGNSKALAAVEAMGVRRQQVLEGGRHQQAEAQPATLPASGLHVAG